VLSVWGEGEGGVGLFCAGDDIAANAAAAAPVGRILVYVSV
jgi:hypothetical protein